MPGPAEWIWIALIFVVLFGAKKLPELARAAGESLREFKKATKEAFTEDETPEPQQRRMEVADERTESASTSAS